VTDVNPVAKALDLSNTPGAATVQMVLEVAGTTMVYRATFNLTYKSNGKIGTGTSY
jgi:hypothetical protein